MYIESIGTVWNQKTTQEKSKIFTKMLNYTKSPCIIFCAKMSQYSYYIYCLQKKKKLTNFFLRISPNFGLEVSAQFGSKITQDIHKYFLELYQPFIHDFVSILHEFIHELYMNLCQFYCTNIPIIHTSQTTYYFTNPILCCYLSQTHFFHLADTSINLILWFNMHYVNC